MTLSFGSVIFYSYFYIITLKQHIMEKKTTESGKSYWDKNGAYQTEYDKLYEELVPSRGEADTIHGEMIRSVSRLFYDFCNNGNCNVRNFEQESCDECGGMGYEEEECSNCYGSGEIECDDEENEPCYDCDGSGVHTNDCSYCGGDCYVDGEVTINDYYQDMIDFLHQHSINQRVVYTVEEFIKRDDLGYGNYTFGKDEMTVYNDLVDAVVYQILTSENQKRIKKDLVN